MQWPDVTALSSRRTILISPREVLDHYLDTNEMRSEIQCLWWGVAGSRFVMDTCLKGRASSRSGFPSDTSMATWRGEADLRLPQFGVRIERRQKCLGHCRPSSHKPGNVGAPVAPQKQVDFIREKVTGFFQPGRGIRRHGQS